MEKLAEKNYRLLTDKFLKVSKMYSSGMSLTDWAEQYRVFSKLQSAMPGKFSFDFVRGSRELHEAYDDPEVNKITICGASQVMKTTFLENICLYHLHLYPTRIILVEPDKAIAKSVMQERIRASAMQLPELEMIPPLVNEFGENIFKSKDTVIKMTLRNGSEIISQSSDMKSVLTSYSSDVILLDEIDKYYNDIITRAESRAGSYENYKIIITSTIDPNASGVSFVWASFKSGSQGEGHVSCLKCKKYFLYGHENFYWEDMDKAHVKCPHCKELFYDNRKLALDKTFKFIHKEKNREHKSFRYSYLISPACTFERLRLQMTETKYKMVEEGNSQPYMDLFHERWAFSYIEKIKEDRKLDLKSFYAQKMPITDNRQKVSDDITIITVGIDVQSTSLVFEIVGWGWHNKCIVRYGLHYEEVSAQNNSHEPNDDTWEELYNKIHNVIRYNTHFDHMPPSCIFADAGFRDFTTKAYCNKFNDRLNRQNFDSGINQNVRVWIPIIGYGREDGGKFSSEVSPYPLKEDDYQNVIGEKKLETKSVLVYVNDIKDTIYDQWIPHDYECDTDSKIFRFNSDPKAGYFSDKNVLRDFYVKSLLAEIRQDVPHKDTGVIKSRYVKHFKRNEALDTCVYSYGALLYTAKRSQYVSVDELLRSRC